MYKLSCIKFPVLAHGQNEPTIPAELEKVDLQFVIKEAYKLMDEYCPSGVEKCECLNAPGMIELFQNLIFLISAIKLKLNSLF